MIRYSHNDQFVEYLRKINWESDTEYDMVQSYLLSLGVMAAIAEGNENTVNPSSNPELTNDVNRFIK